MAATVFLIRHGQSTFNAHHAATGQDPGHIDARLTDLGHQQVAAARAQAAGLGPLDLVISSPLTRALQTTLGLFGDAGTPVEVTCRHRERLEAFCDLGRPPADLAADFPALRFDHLDDRWWHDGPPGPDGLPIEPLDLFTARVAGFAEWLAAHPAARVAVVGHGAFFRHLTGGHSFANCEILPWSPRVA
jgi:broad specificity phosphatase PhoE